MSTFKLLQRSGFRFVVRPGSKGDVGDTGETGPTGDTGPANTLTIGTVEEGAADATITGTAPDQTLNLVIPKGDTGDQGPQGDPGQDGIMASVVAGTGVDVDATDPANPIVTVEAAIVSGAALGATAVQPARQVVSGAGLTGGGDLSADRTLAVGAGTGIIANADDVAIDKATAANVRAATSNKVLTGDIVFSAMAEVAITDVGNTYTPDFSAGFDFSVSLDANSSLANGSNLKVGQRGRIRVVQDAGGSKTMTFGTDYEFTAGAAPVLSTGANAQDILYYDIIAAGRVFISLVGRAIA